MQELLKIIKGLGIPVVIILIIWFAITAYKNYLQIKFWNLSIKDLENKFAENKKG